MDTKGVWAPIKANVVTRLVLWAWSLVQSGSTTESSAAEERSVDKIAKQLIRYFDKGAVLQPSVLWICREKVKSVDRVSAASGYESERPQFPGEPSLGNNEGRGLQ